MIRQVSRSVALIVLAPILTIVVLFAGAAPAQAHAVLLSSSPADGSRLDTAPSEVSMTFNEDVSVLTDSLRVFDADGDRVDRGALRHDGTSIAIDVLPDLPAGSYVAAYRVTSSDGHPVRGGVVFAVGDAVADPGLLDQVFDTGGDRVWSIGAAIGRWLVLAGSLGAAGVAVAVVRGPTAPPRSRSLVGALAVVGVVGAAIVLLTQTALLTGRGVTSIGESGVFEAVWGDGALGLSLVVAIGAAVSAALTVRVAGRLAPVTAFGSVALGAVGAALSGHTRSGSDEIAAIASTSVHAGVVAIWLGGLLAGALGGWFSEAARLAHLRRFSGWAMVSVVVVATTGIVLSYREVRAVDAVDTAYGMVLLAKLVVVAAVLVVATRVRRGLGEAAMPRGRLLRVETAGLVLVLGLTAIMVNVTPARVAAGIGEIASATIDLGDVGRVDVVVDPARPGATNTVHFYVFDETGRVADRVEEAIVSLSLPAADIGPIVREPDRAGPAHFILVGDELVLAGMWEIEVQIRESRFTSATGSAEVLIR